MKRSNTHPLTAADILDIVLAVVKAMPQPQDATSSMLRRSSRRVQDTTDQASQSMRSCSTPSITDPQDSTDEEDIKNKDFGKLLYTVAEFSTGCLFAAEFSTWWFLYSCMNSLQGDFF